MRSRTLLLIAFVALLGAVAAVLGATAAKQALATAPSAVTLHVNENCVELKWPCWAESTATYAQPASRVTIAEGGEIEFVDEASTAPNVSVNWIGAKPSCTGVPTTATPPNWHGTCKFATPGTYDFESSTMFYEPPGLYSNNLDYRKYEVVVTGPPTPTATTEQATAVTETEATLNGSIDPEGYTVEYHFEYEGPGVAGKQSTPTATLTAADFTSHSVSAKVNSLEPAMTYHFHVVAFYGVGKTKVEGGGMTLKTAAPPSAPMVSTLAASALKETEATLNGKVDPEGGAKAEYFFEWGVGGGVSYEHTTPVGALSTDSAEHPVSATVTGLTPGSGYHFRLVAKNELGSGQGNDLTFMAASTPPAKEPTKEPPPTSPPTGGSPTSTTTTPQVTSATIQEKATKPLTRAQKLTKALKQCKKQPKKKRAKCEAKAKKLYGPKHKSHKK